MKRSLVPALLALVTALLAGLTVPRAAAQNATDTLELVRAGLQADRQVLVAEALQLQDAQSAAFWPLYRQYRADMEKIGDGLVKLILEYADVFPEVPEDRATALLKEYQNLEKRWLSTRARHLKRFGRVLPPSQVLRLAQVENRLDLALRLQLAGALPLAPAPSR